MGQNTFTMEELANFKLPDAAAAVAEPAKEKPEPVAAAAEPAEPVETKVEAVAEPEAPTAVEAEPEPEHMVPKGRFNQVIEERNALRKQNEYLMELAVNKPAKAAEAPAAAPDPMPTLESAGFDTGKYEAEMKAWTQKRVATAEAEGKKVGAVEAHAAEVKAGFEARMASYAAANPKVVVALGNPSLPTLAKDAAEYVMESDLGPQILHHLGMHPDEAVRIARQTPAKQAAALGRIEGEIQARSKASANGAGKRMTQAPNPPEKVSGASSPVVDPNKLSTTEWIKWDRAQEDAKRAARHKH